VPRRIFSSAKAHYLQLLKAQDHAIGRCSVENLRDACDNALDASGEYSHTLFQVLERNFNSSGVDWVSDRVADRVIPVLLQNYKSTVTLYFRPVRS
jgi:hypothetical protein